MSCQDSIDQIRATLNPRLEKIDYPVAGPTFYKASYDGWRKARIFGWYITPAGAGPFPTIVVYHGYGGNRGPIFGLLPWVAAGYAVLANRTLDAERRRFGEFLGEVAG